MKKKNIGIILIIVIVIIISIILLSLYRKNNVNKMDIIDDEIKKENVNNIMMYIKVKDKVLTTTLYDNSSVDGLIDELKKGDMTIEMNDYANMEKVGYLDFSLPRNDENINTSAGDIILYQGNQFVIYYDNNSWSLTRIGKINDISEKELRDLLGSDSVEVTLSLSE